MEQVRRTEKREKYSTNERTKQKCTIPNKQRGNKQSTFKRIQNNDSKGAPKTEYRMEKMQEAFNIVNTVTKDIEEIKNKQTEMNNTITEIKNTPEGNNSRITEAEEQISELEDRMMKITAEEQIKRKE